VSNTQPAGQHPAAIVRVASNPGTREQPLTAISATAVVASRAEFFADLWAESDSKYRGEFQSFFTTFVHVFSQVVADDVAYIVDCLSVSV